MRYIRYYESINVDKVQECIQPLLDNSEYKITDNDYFAANYRNVYDQLTSDFIVYHLNKFNYSSKEELFEDILDTHTKLSNLEYVTNLTIKVIDRSETFNKNTKIEEIEDYLINSWEFKNYLRDNFNDIKIKISATKNKEVK